MMLQDGLRLTYTNPLTPRYFNRGDVVWTYYIPSEIKYEGPGGVDLLLTSEFHRFASCDTTSSVYLTWTEWPGPYTTNIRDPEGDGVRKERLYD